MLILGLDPGSVHTGFGLVRHLGSELTVVDAGRLLVDGRAQLPARLADLATATDRLLDDWSPDAAVLETLFHGPNARSLIVLAEARGAILSRLGQRGVTVAEYSPAEVKRAVTGNGRADKRQVARMVELLLTLTPRQRPSDATDALALAICYAQRHRMERLAERLSCP